MITLGIDLASQDKNTAICVLDWSGLVPRVVDCYCGRECTDPRLDELSAKADAVGVDAPFGWPGPFVVAVNSWEHVVWNSQLRDELTWRLTDRWVIDNLKLHPLRVAADLIALPAMRAMALLRRHEVVDRSGPEDGKFFEVYPAASLYRWGLVKRGVSYKRSGDAGIDARRTILDGLRKRFGLEANEKIADTDHTLDALVAAITARFAKIGKTGKPMDEKLDVARVEGWIHVPLEADR